MAENKQQETPQEVTMVPISFTFSFDRHDPRDVRNTLQKSMERLVGMTISCGVPYQLNVDYQDWDPRKAKGVGKIIQLVKQEGPTIKRPKGMKGKHNALIRWTAHFDKELVDRVKSRTPASKKGKPIE